MALVREVVWHMRDNGQLQILQRGAALECNVGVKGPITARAVLDEQQLRG